MVTVKKKAIGVDCGKVTTSVYISTQGSSIMHLLSQMTICTGRNAISLNKVVMKVLVLAYTFQPHC